VTQPRYRENSNLKLFSLKEDDKSISKLKKTILFGYYLAHERQAKNRS